MRVVTCLLQEHDLWFVLLSVLMCGVGAAVSTTLFQRTLNEQGSSRLLWCFLSAVTAGASTWATHFIAMLGYRTHVAVSFDGGLTLVSALVAIGGIGAGLLIATSPRRWLASVAGGGTIGLAIAAMHYIGMFAYRVDGIVTWRPAYVLASLLLVCGLGVLLVDSLRRRRRWEDRLVPGVLLAAAIVVLHFTGIAAFSVMPIAGAPASVNAPALSGLAIAIAVVGLLLLGMGISTYLVEAGARSFSRKQLAHIAMHDSLTDLANRHHFSTTLDEQCAALGRNGRPFALLMVDLDRFKPVNDTLGHPTGDAVLRLVAKRLQLAVRKSDLVARIGGDEFAIIAFDLSSLAEAEAIAGRVVEILSRPFLVGGNMAELGGSVGMVLAPGHGLTGEELVQHADIALYAAKRAGKNRYCVFEPEMMEAMQRRRHLEVELRRACMREDFTVVYQPIVDSQSGTVTGAEALLRWTCPGRGEVSPAEFIPIAEDLGLVSRIGASVLRQACEEAASWSAPLDISVNVSPVQLLDPRLPQVVAQALAESGLSPERLELEITETALFGDDEAALRTLTLLRELGVRISLDDFGTGYSSLSYLHRFPITRIKIDQSFVRRLPEDPGSASIVRAIAQLGESLELQITAEGIETSEQLSFVALHGCNHAQGYLISRPIKAGEFAEFIRTGAASLAA
jgi:diguanylate cyclase (GGDEF)-like protein